MNSSQTSDYSTNNSRNHGLTVPSGSTQGVPSGIPSSQQPTYGYSNNFPQPATHCFGGGVAR